MRPTTSPATTPRDARPLGWMRGGVSGDRTCPEADSTDTGATPGCLPERRERPEATRGPALTDSRAQPDARMVT